LDAFITTQGTAPPVEDDVLLGLAALSLPEPMVEGLTPTPLLEDSLQRAVLLNTGQVREGLQLFGLNMFRTPTSQFVPIQSGPVPTNYRLGPGEVMVLVLTGGVEAIHELEVTREGFVVIPRVGQVFVNGLTLNAFRSVLEGRLSDSYSGIQDGSTRFDISITRLHANQIFVTGEVARPGAYQLSSLATILNAIFTAGGVTERGNLRTVQLLRGDEIFSVLDLYDYLLRASISNDVLLEQGDIVFVPTMGKRVSLSGAIVRPAIYELSDGETLPDLIDAAGGFLPVASLDRISVTRILRSEVRRPGEPARIAIDVLMDPAGSQSLPSFELEAGDRIHVFAVVEDIQSTVSLRGNIYYPGDFAWTPGLRLGELIERAGGLRPATYAGVVHVERLNVGDSTRYLVSIPLPVSGAGIPSNGVEIQEYDVITVYGRDEFRADRVVSIGGMVTEPGTYPYRADMTLRDLILQARGLLDGAYLEEVEIARLPESREDGQLAQRLRVSIDSTYVLERGSSFPLLPGQQTLESGSPDVELRPFDLVTVLKQPQFELLRSVHVTGEVRFPGPYALETRDERVSSLIRRAGGLIPSAYPEGSRFYRPFGEAGRINLDLVAALSSPTERDDFILQSDDSLHIPGFDPTVRIVGAVNTPGSVLYEAGRDLSYYIGAAGGYAAVADPDKVGVQYANGLTEVTDNGFWFFGSSPTPRPGSIVMVPERDPDDNSFDLSGFMGALASVLASTVAIVVVATR